MARLNLKLINNEDYIPMSFEILIVPTIPAHLRELAANLRKEDEKEILAFGRKVHHVLWRSYKSSLMRRTAFIDGKLAACWGCAGELLGSQGIPWLLTTPEVKKISPLKFARIYQQEVTEMLGMFPKLVNYVDPDYTASIRMLDIMGFKVSDSELILGVLVRKFEKEIEYV